jgi:hypothetical protein
MLSDAYVQAICDNCSDEEEIQLDYRYRSYSERIGFYDDSEVPSKLEAKGWISASASVHFCCEECEKRFQEKGK